MSGPRLFPSRRVCCLCGADASSHLRGRIPGEPNILAITPLLYRRGSGKGRLRNAQSIHICESCLAKSLTPGRLRWNERQGDERLWEAFRSSLLDRYSSMLKEDQG